MFFTTALKAYRELIESGYVRSSAKGGQVSIHLQGSFSGDVLVCISPSNPLTAEQDTLALALSDADLDKNIKQAFSEFRQKLNSLMLLPKSLVWMLNIGFSSYLAWRFYKPFISLFVTHDYQADFVYLLPEISLIAAAWIFSGKLGITLLKPAVFLVSRGHRLVKFLCKSKVQ